MGLQQGDALRLSDVGRHCRVPAGMAADCRRKFLAYVASRRTVSAPHSWLCQDLGLSCIGRRIDNGLLGVGTMPWLRGRRDDRKAKRRGARIRGRGIDGRIAGSREGRLQIRGA